MTFTNVLHINEEIEREFLVTVVDGGGGGLEGIVRTIYDKRFEKGENPVHIWHKIKDSDRKSDNITYIIAVIRGSTILAYVGKTIQTFQKRYKGNPTGGLKIVFDTYIDHPEDSFMECTLYNTSSPAFVEGWCYQLLQYNKITLANIVDPN